MENEIKKGMFEISLEVKLLISAGSKINEDEVWTYEQIEKACGIDIRQKRGIMATVRKHLLRENGIAFEVVSKVGYRRLFDHEKINSVEYARRRNEKTICRTKEIIGTMNVEKLSPVQLVGFNTSVSILQAEEKLLAPKTREQVEKKISETGNILPVGKILELCDK